MQADHAVPDPAAHVPREWVVEWYRPKTLQRLLRGVIVPAIMIAAGACVLAVMGVSGPETYSVLITLMGLILTILGPFFGIRHFLLILGEDRCLTLKNTGLTYDRDSAHYAVLWDVLDDVVLDEQTGQLRVTSEDGEPFLIDDAFISISQADLAKRILTVRTQALMGLLRPPVADPAPEIKAR